MPKLRIVVLLGGRSNEREISLESGRNVCYKLSTEKYEAIPVFLSQQLELYRLNQQLLVRYSTAEIAEGLQASMKLKWSDLPTIADFVFIALHGGEGENGVVQGALEMLGMPYNGSSIFASALCMDKYKTNSFLHGQGFNVPASYLIAKAAWQTNKEHEINQISKILSYPVIVKPHDDGCSVMVAKTINKEELVAAIETIFANNKSYALVEECMVGMELTVGVIGNEKPQALPPSQAIAVKGILSIEEKFLPGQGENQTPAPLSADAISFVQRTIEQVFATVGCKGYARIDCFYQSAEQSPTGNERLIILEINTLPGLTPATCIFHQAAELNISPAQFIDMIIQFGLDYWQQQTFFSSQNKTEGKQHETIYQ